MADLGQVVAGVLIFRVQNTLQFLSNSRENARAGPQPIANPKLIHPGGPRPRTARPPLAQRRRLGRARQDDRPRKRRLAAAVPRADGSMTGPSDAPTASSLSRSGAIAAAHRRRRPPPQFVALGGDRAEPRGCLLLLLPRRRLRAGEDERRVGHVDVRLASTAAAAAAAAAAGRRVGLSGVRLSEYLPAMGAE